MKESDINTIHTNHTVNNTNELADTNFRFFDEVLNNKFAWQWLDETGDPPPDTVRKSKSKTTTEDEELRKRSNKILDLARKVKLEAQKDYTEDEVCTINDAFREAVISSNNIKNNIDEGIKNKDLPI